jgi:hypothetical protein
MQILPYYIYYNFKRANLELLNQVKDKSLKGNLKSREENMLNVYNDYNFNQNIKYLNLSTEIFNQNHKFLNSLFENFILFQGKGLKHFRDKITKEFYIIALVNLNENELFSFKDLATKENVVSNVINSLYNFNYLPEKSNKLLHPTYNYNKCVNNSLNSLFFYKIIKFNKLTVCEPNTWNRYSVFSLFYKILLNLITERVTSSVLRVTRQWVFNSGKSVRNLISFINIYMSKKVLIRNFIFRVNKINLRKQKTKVKLLYKNIWQARRFLQIYKKRARMTIRYCQNRREYFKQLDTWLGKRERYIANRKKNFIKIKEKYKIQPDFNLAYHLKKFDTNKNKLNNFIRYNRYKKRPRIPYIPTQRVFIKMCKSVFPQYYKTFSWPDKRKLNSLIRFYKVNKQSFTKYLILLKLYLKRFLCYNYTTFDKLKKDVLLFRTKLLYYRVLNSSPTNEVNFKSLINILQTILCLFNLCFKLFKKLIKYNSQIKIIKEKIKLTPGSINIKIKNIRRHVRKDLLFSKYKRKASGQYYLNNVKFYNNVNIYRYKILKYNIGSLFSYKQLGTFKVWGLFFKTFLYKFFKFRVDKRNLLKLRMKISKASKRSRKIPHNYFTGPLLFYKKGKPYKYYKSKNNKLLLGQKIVPKIREFFFTLFKSILAYKRKVLKFRYYFYLCLKKNYINNFFDNFYKLFKYIIWFNFVSWFFETFLVYNIKLYSKTRQYRGHFLGLQIRKKVDLLLFQSGIKYLIIYHCKYFAINTLSKISEQYILLYFLIFFNRIKRFKKIFNNKLLLFLFYNYYFNLIEKIKIIKQFNSNYINTVLLMFFSKLIISLLIIEKNSAKNNNIIDLLFLDQLLKFSVPKFI